MRRLLIVAPEALGRRLAADLGRYGYVSTVSFPEVGMDADVDAVLLDAGDNRLEDLCPRFKTESRIPVIGLFKKPLLTEKAPQACDDFVLEPYDASEINARLKKLFATQIPRETRHVAAEGLVIDTGEATVYLNGEPLELTFREYQLLRFLAEHPGKVFSRDALLNAVWGYDYFGGDRTVDVHVRRLRSKIEDPEHSYIDTVRNIGYRFKKQPDVTSPH